MSKFPRAFVELAVTEVEGKVARLVSDIDAASEVITILQDTDDNTVYAMLIECAMSRMLAITAADAGHTDLHRGEFEESVKCLTANLLDHGMETFDVNRAVHKKECDKESHGRKFKTQREGD